MNESTRLHEIEDTCFCYYAGCDSYGGDMEFKIPIRMIQDYLQNDIRYGNTLSDSISLPKDTVAFNTLGYIKKQLNEHLEPVTWCNENTRITGNDGIFIKKSSWHYLDQTIDNTDNRLVIITPCSRIHNLSSLYASMNEYWHIIKHWIIVYDDSTIADTYSFTNDDDIDIIIPHEHESKIVELRTSGNGISGNDQRNYALDWLELRYGENGKDDFFIYYLDDDNIIHYEFWNVFAKLEKDYLYTFSQLRENGQTILHGNKIKWLHIDTAQFLGYYPLIKQIRWLPSMYMADFFYIHQCVINNYQRHRVLDKVISYYNIL